MSHFGMQCKHCLKSKNISKLIFVCVFQVAMSTMDNPLLKYNAKEYFFKASLCHFIVDELNAKVMLMFLF